MQPQVWSLERLLWKYRILATLRARREELEAAGRSCFEPAEAVERKRLFRRVAREFPGALRELDSFPAGQLVAKAETIELELGRVRCGGGGLARGEWTAVILDYHQTLREALMVKRWIALRLPRDTAIPPTLVRAFTQRIERMHRLRGEPTEPGMGAALRRHDEHAELLARHLRPPGGRILSLIWEGLERRHGRPRPALEAMLFG